MGYSKRTNATPTIKRANKDSENPYRAMSRAMFEDRSISFEAKGIMGYILVKPDDWSVQVTDLRRVGDIGRDKVYKIIKELIAAGYIDRQVERNPDGTMSNTVYLVYEEPLTDLPDTAEPDTAEPDTVNTDHTKEEVLVNNNFTKEEEKQTPSPPSLRNTLQATPNASQGDPRNGLNNGTGDPLMDEAAAKHDERQKRGSVAKGSWQAEMNLRLAAAIRIPLSDSVGKACGLTALMDTSDKVLAEVQDAACWFHELGYDVAGIDELYRVYLSDEWRRNNHPYPSVDAFMRFASKKVESPASTNGSIGASRTSGVYVGVVENLR